MTDILIIGGGTAGCVLARRLTDNSDLNVLLIEAGSDSDLPEVRNPRRWLELPKSAVDWGYRTTPQKNTSGREHPMPRGLLLGGSGSINAMAHVRGHPSDFDSWVEMGCHGWGYQDLLPYFRRSESSSFSSPRFHGESGPLHLIQPVPPHPITQCYLQAVEDLGYQAIPEHNAASMAGPTLNTLTIKDGERFSVYDAYLRPVRSRPNLEVIDQCLVDKLLFDQVNRCRGVSVVRSGQVWEIWADVAVVLCAGTVGSPQILMRSGIGCSAKLESIDIPVLADSPKVGENLHDHLLGAGNVYLSKRKVPTSAYQHSESLFYAGSQNDKEAPEKVVACVSLPVVSEMFEAPEVGDAYTLLYGFTSPRSRGFVRLTSADPTIHPLIDPAYLSSDYDRRVLSEALDLSREIGSSDAFRDWRLKELLPGASIKTSQNKSVFNSNAAWSHHHPVGTCSMGSDSNSVVSLNLAVNGVERLFVVDGSIIPKITTGPVNAAIIAIAEKAADLLEQHLES